MRVKYEGANRDADQALRNYFALLKDGRGLGFSQSTSAKYAPMDPKTLKATLIDLERKDKSSKLMQIADTYVYAIARGKYDGDFPLFAELVASKRLIDAQLEISQVETTGIKYYCF